MTLIVVAIKGKDYVMELKRDHYELYTYQQLGIDLTGSYSIGWSFGVVILSAIITFVSFSLFIFEYRLLQMQVPIPTAEGSWWTFHKIWRCGSHDAKLTYPRGSSVVRWYLIITFWLLCRHWCCLFSQNQEQCIEIHIKDIYLIIFMLGIHEQTASKEELCSLIPRGAQPFSC